MSAQLDGVGRLGDLGSRLQQPAQLVHGRLTLLVGVVLLHEQLDGGEEAVQVQEEPHEHPERQAPAQHHVAPDAEQHTLPEHAEHLGARPVDGVDLGGVVVGVAVLADDVAVMDDVLALAVVGGDDAHAVQALGQVGEHVGDAVADLVVAALRGDPEPQRHHREDRDDQDDGDEGQPHVPREQADRDDDHREALDGELGETVLQQLLEVLDVARHAAHDDAGLLRREETQRQPLQMREHLDTQIVHDPGGEATGDLHLCPLGEGADDDRHEIDDGRHDHDLEAVVRAGHPVVDGVLGDRRPRLGGHGDDDDEDGRQPEHPRVLGEQAPEREALLLLGGRELGEGDGGVGVGRLFGEELVDARLQLRRDATEGEARRGPRPAHWRPAASEHHESSPPGIVGGRSRVGVRPKQAVAGWARRSSASASASAST